jgi:2,4-dichlorophenol 6-monooxygenase
VQDAFNLAWKLNLVLSGHADEKLLESYNQERQPIGDRVVSHAIETLHVFGKVPQVLGFHHGQSTEDGYKSLQALFTDAEGQQERRDELRKVIDLQNLRSNPLGIQLGHRYQKSCAVVDDGTPFPELKRDPVMFYQPTTHPGGYLPHAWVEKDRKQLSTLDIVPNDKFSLIVGIGGDPYLSAAKSISSEYRIELPVYRIGYRCTYDDVLGQWADIREITDRGAILVRPDRHIAWRSLDRPADVEEALRSAVGKLLKKPS